MLSNIYFRKVYKRKRDNEILQNNKKLKVDNSNDFYFKEFFISFYILSNIHLAFSTSPKLF